MRRRNSPFHDALTTYLAEAAKAGVAPPMRVAVRGKGSNAEADLYVYDAIDADYGIGSRHVIDALASTDAKRINLRINSPGGDVFEARAMVTALRAARAQGREVVAYIDGLAASAASYLAIAADRVVMSDGAFLMIHKAWALAMGNAGDMLAMAGVLAKVDDSIVDDYRRKTGASRAKLEAWMAAETWFTATEARAAGFVDEVVGDERSEGARGAGTFDAMLPRAGAANSTAEDAAGRARAARMVAWHGAVADTSEASRAEQSARAAVQRLLERIAKREA
jgi:ATP-dependent Clp protease protease subunit